MSAKRLHQPDINGTHAGVNQPLSPETQAIFKEWMAQGNYFSPNTSFTIRKIAENINSLANSPYITEIGVAVHEADTETLLIYHPFTHEERKKIAYTFFTEGEEKFKTAGFFPKYEKGDNHGTYLYLHPKVSILDAKKLLSRHFAIEKITADYKEFTSWIQGVEKEFGMFEFTPTNEIPAGFKDMHFSFDSGGTFFITPQGVDKATTFLELINLRFKDIPWENISIAGDSKPTDGPMFTLPNIMHIAVKEKELLVDVPGKNVFVETPDEATDIIKELLNK